MWIYEQIKVKRKLQWLKFNANVATAVSVWLTGSLMT
jgi:hypothetical protein